MSLKILLSDQELAFIYYRNKKDLDEFTSIIHTDPELYKEIVKDKYYILCKNLDFRLEKLIKPKILKRLQEIVFNEID